MTYQRSGARLFPAGRWGLSLLLIACLAWAASRSQDSLAVQQARLADSIQRVAAADSVRKAVADSVLANSFAVRFRKNVKYKSHPYFRFSSPVAYPVAPRQAPDKDAIFYAVIAILLYFAGIRNGFYRYVQDLFRIYFKTTMRQRQIKEQLSQTPLPSLLLNILFIISIATLAALALQHFGLGAQFNFWLLLLYSIIGLSCMYAVKFLSLKFFGWVFGMAEAIDAYIFIVFTTNKVTGVLILPLLMVVAFSLGTVMQVAFVLCATLIGGLLAYRYVLSYGVVQQGTRISSFHFLLYLCAFEIAPLLLINKLLFSVLT